MVWELIAAKATTHGVVLVLTGLDNLVMSFERTAGVLIGTHSLVTDEQAARAKQHLAAG
jgi:hypothetical protein